MKEHRDGYILIVDDEPDSLSVLASALEDDGWLVRVAQDGESALAAVIDELPSLVLLDILMPGMDGIRTCRHLKDNPDTCEVPVIFLSALADKKSKVAGLSSGAVDYITKPFETDEVLARVRIHSRQSKLLNKLYQDRCVWRDRVLRFMRQDVDLEDTQQTLTQTLDLLAEEYDFSEADVSLIEDYANQVLAFVYLYKESCSAKEIYAKKIVQFCQNSIEKIDNWLTPEDVDRQRKIGEVWAMLQAGLDYRVTKEDGRKISLMILEEASYPLDVIVAKSFDGTFNQAGLAEKYWLESSQDDPHYPRAQLLEMCDRALTDNLLQGNLDAIKSIGRDWAMLQAGCRYEVRRDDEVEHPGHLVLQIEDPLDRRVFSERLPLVTQKDELV